MKILTYLAFTMLSVLIQFCVIDYIQAKLELDEIKPNPLYLNATSQTKHFVDIIKEYGDGKPQALYYRTDSAKLQDKLPNVPSTPIYADKNLSANPITTENPPTSTVYDILYEENVTSVSESTTPELPVTATEFENITDLTIFNTNNATDAKHIPSPKEPLFQGDCYCSLLYHICDINCCCDRDCTDNERSLFNCTEKGNNGPEEAHFCLAQGSESHMLSGIENLFCVVKINLPEKRNNIHKKYNAVEVSKLTENAMKWHDKSEPRIPIALSPKLYSRGDPVWVLRNNSVTYIDFPIARINGNCDSRTPIFFLDEQQVQCNVVLAELEMFNILKTIEETKVISVKSMNNTSNLNCSELLCTDLKIIVCNETTCTNYTRDWHEPYCTDNMDVICKNIATKVDYVFYYFNSKIVDAVLHFHIQTVSSKVQFIRQEVSVQFYLAENSAKKIITLSGNPGYLKGYPLIASFENDNYTKNFFNNGSKLSNMLNYPINENGNCLFTNTTNFVKFGANKRTKCRFTVEALSKNATESCEIIYKNIKHILGIRRVVVSRLGNPHGLEDEDWIALFMDAKLHEVSTVGELHGESDLICYHMVTKLSLYFGFADVSAIAGKEKLKILTASVRITTQNITITEEQTSVILTFETSFTDVTKPPAYEYAGSPQLNIHLPRDLFFPFPSNRCYRLNYECNVAILVLCLVLTFIPK